MTTPTPSKSNNPASELTREHYSRPEVKSTILRICKAQSSYRWLIGGSMGWYKGNENECYGNKGYSVDYDRVTNIYRTLHYTTGFFSPEVFETDLAEMRLDNGVESALNRFSKLNCTSYTGLFDIDTIDEVNGHGTNIEQPEVKAAVEKMVKFVCDDLKQHAPNSVYAAFSGGGAYVLLHHTVFQDYIDYFAGKENQLESIIVLSDALNSYIISLVQRFRDTYPEYGKYVKIDAINQPKRAVKALLSIHRKKPYAVIPLDTENPVIDFEAARVPLKDEVIQSCSGWYEIGDRENGFLEMLHPLVLEAQQERKVKQRYSSADNTCVLPEVQDIPDISHFPPCMKNIIEKPTGGEGQTRALGVLAAFLGHIGWSREDAYSLWSSVATRWKAETSNIFESWYGRMKCASCKTLMEDKHYPYVGLIKFGVCKPDYRCLNKKLSSPVYVASEELYLKSFESVKL